MYILMHLSFFVGILREAIQNGNAWSNALIKVIFAFGGYNNANNLVNEIPNPVRTLKVYSNIALGIVSLLYMLSAVAFFAWVVRYLPYDLHAEG